MMRSRFDEQLEKLNAELVEMGSMVEYAIDSAAKALVERDAELARKIIAFDTRTDEKEKEIETLCLKLLLQQQPVAKDLRFISAALKMITDMERIGDQSADISEIVLLLEDQPPIQRFEPVLQMADETTYMVTAAIDAFVRRDLAVAKRVIAHDDVVDDLFMVIRGELIELIRENIDYGEQAMDLLMIAKYFERIGDHATNIAEWVEFAITGIHSQEATPPKPGETE